MTQSINIYCNVDLSDGEKLATSFAEYRKIDDFVQTLTQIQAIIKIKSINRGVNVKQDKTMLLYSKGVYQSVRKRKNNIYYDTVNCMLWVAKNVLLSDKKTLHVFYNLPPHYWLGITIALILGRKVIYDIEDFPTFKNGMFLTNIISMLSRAFIKLPVDLKICSSVGFVDKVNSPSTLYYGRLPVRENSSYQRKNNVIGIHFGGHIDTDTGLHQFVDLINRFKQYQGPRFINIFVTGNTGNLESLSYKSKFVEVIVVRNMPTTELNYLLKNKIHIGLSLKKADGLYGTTTFPSKIVNYWRNNIIVASTVTPDLKINFSGCYVPLKSDGANIYKTLVNMIHRDDFFEHFIEKTAKASSLVSKYEDEMKCKFKEIY